MEFINKEMDKLIENLGQWVVQDLGKPSVLNPKRLQQLLFANSTLERVTKGSDTKITTKLHEPLQSMGSICLEGDSLEFGDCLWLGRVIQVASNVEIYPLLEEKVRLVLTFHNLTTIMRTK